MVYANVDLVFYGILALIIASSGYILIKYQSKMKYKKGRFFKSPLFVIMCIGLIASALTPANPVNQNWIWQQFSDVTPNPYSTGLHTDYNGQKVCNMVGMTFAIADGYDLDGAYAGTEADSIGVTTYTGDVGLAMKTFDLFSNNQISKNDWMEIASLTAIESKAAASGVWTSGLTVYTSNVEYILELGTFNADETGNDPLKSQFVVGVLQGDDSSDTPTNCKFGLGVINYWGFPDEDDIALTLVTTSGKTAVGATTLDWSDETDNKFDLDVVVTFTSVECGLHSYYERAAGVWWNWYIVIDFVEDNCTTVDAIEPSISGYTDAYASNSEGIHWYFQLSTARLYRSNARPNDIAYLTDVGGDTIAGFEAIQYFGFSIDLGSATSVGSDNDRAFEMMIDIGTEFNVNQLLSSGVLKTDTDNNYHTDNAVLYYVVA